jgi:hypothetical protein
MGYVIQPIDIITKVLIIPEADVLVMDISPYSILQITNGGIQCISISVKVLPGGSGYTGFNHLYLLDTATIEIVGVYDEAAIGVPIDVGYNTFLILNMRHPPNKFGAFSKDNSGLSLNCSAPMSGTGDLQVSFQYRLLP